MKATIAEKKSQYGLFESVSFLIDVTRIKVYAKCHVRLPSVSPEGTRGGKQHLVERIHEQVQIQ
jgi:hypothetical protein